MSWPREWSGLLLPAGGRRRRRLTERDRVNLRSAPPQVQAPGKLGLSPVSIVTSGR